MIFISFGLTIASQAADTPFILVDANSGEILSENKANDRWYPASLTKLMTAYVTFRAIANGKIEDGSPVVISNAATRQPPSRMGYKQGVMLRIDTALKIIIIKSANDVSHALAEAVAGSVPAFVKRMNEEAQRLGLSNTQFSNSNGLHSQSQYTSPRDIAVLSARILKEFPQYAYMYKAVGIKTAVKTHYSYNLLLERFSGTNGMKTGFVCASGYNMVASAERGGRTLIAVVMGKNSQKDRAVAAAKLLTEGFGKGTSSGRSIFSANNSKSARPVNMRSKLCTEQARKNRYDPGAGLAEISSKYLSARQRSNNVLTITTGGIDAAPSQAVQVAALTAKSPPIPTRRPIRKTPVSLEAIGDIRTGRIALPTQRPQ